MLEKMLRTAEDTDADIVMCDAEVHYDDRVETYKSTEWTDDKISSLRAFIDSEWTVVWNMLVKKSLYDQHAIVSPEGITQCEDFHLSVRLCHFANKIVHLPEALYCYNRMNIGSMTNDRSLKRIESELKVYDDIISFCKNEGVYNNYEKNIGWRVLWAKLPFLFDKNSHDRYLSIHPECHKYISSCPHYYPKLRLMAWSLTHGLRPMANLMLKLWQRNNP